MNININGFKFENVNVEEAIQIAKGCAKIKKSKGGYHKTQVYWTDDEIAMLKENKGLTPKQLHKYIPRHTTGAISFKKRSLWRPSGNA